MKGEIKVTYNGGGSTTITMEESPLEDEIVPNNETVTAMDDWEVSTLRTRGTLSPKELKELMGTMSLEFLDAMKRLVASVLARIGEEG